MKEKAFQRARSPAAKEQRRAALLGATGRLLDEGGVDAVTLSGIAREAGIAKSALYTYFESREDILLELMHEDWTAAVGEAELALAPHAGCDDPAIIAELITKTYLVRPRLCGLASVVASVLEKNVSEERIYEFKLGSIALGVRMANMLHVALPSLPFDRCAWLLRPMFAVVAGMWPVTHPPPHVEKVMKRPELAMLQPDLESDLKRAFEALLRGEIAAAR